MPRGKKTIVTEPEGKNSCKTSKKMGIRLLLGTGGLHGGYGLEIWNKLRGHAITTY